MGFDSSFPSHFLRTKNMEGIKAKWSFFEAQLNKELENIPLLVLIEEKSNKKVQRAHIALGVVAFLFLFVLFGIWDKWIVNILGFVFPAYASIKAIESVSKDDDTQWLTYWVVFGLFTVLEFFSPTILWAFSWYYVVKFFFILWLMSPVHNGANIFYQTILRRIWGRIPKLPVAAGDSHDKKKKHDSDDEDSE